MAGPLTRRELDRRRCTDPTCTKDHGAPTRLEVFPLCCAAAGVKTWLAKYDQVSGVLELRCSRCFAIGGRVAVADGDDA